MSSAMLSPTRQRPTAFLVILFTLLLSALSTLASPVVTRRLSSTAPSDLSRRLAEELASFSVTGLSKRDVVVPRITSPDASSVWPIGSRQTVTWDTSDFPPVDQITNILGRVILGWDSGDSLNLQLDNPLAEGFNITLGRIDVTVPSVPPRPDYLIVLMGNSGNTSPSFAITSISGGGSSSSSSATPVSSNTSPSSTSSQQAPAAPTRPATPSSSSAAPDAEPTTTIPEPSVAPEPTTTNDAGPATTDSLVPSDTATSAAPTGTSGEQANAEGEDGPANAACSLKQRMGGWSLGVGLVVAGLVVGI